MADRRNTKPGAVSRAETSLAGMLIMTRDLDRLSIDSLARSYRVPRTRIEEMLAAERNRRGSTHGELA